MNQRTKILPGWIRLISCFLFLYLGTPVLVFIGHRAGYVSWSFYGMVFEGSVYHPIAIVMVLFGTLHGIAAYGLLRGKGWAIDLAVLSGLVGIASTLVSMIRSWNAGEIHLGISAVFWCVAISDLLSIRKRWVG